MILHLKAFVFFRPHNTSALSCLDVLSKLVYKTILYLERHSRKTFRRDLNKATVKISKMFQKPIPHIF